MSVCIYIASWRIHFILSSSVVVYCFFVSSLYLPFSLKGKQTVLLFWFGKLEKMCWVGFFFFLMSELELSVVTVLALGFHCFK